jgi:flagellar biosynthesis/type III secretory pathway M-ring protein FliF/YscJ
MQSLVARWQGLGPRRRGLVTGLSLAALCAVAGVSFFGRDARVPLFVTPLRGDQLAEVVERLAEWNVPFIAGSDNVKVDARRRNDVLLRLSLGGVPHLHRAGSSETLERIGPLTPQSVLDAQQREGLAGDLAAALRGIAGVDDAQVIIAPGRQAAFSDESSSPPSAGVRLRLKAGARLERDAIEGIRRFVADSVSGLSGARVAILDDRGVALDGGRMHSDDANALETSLQTALDQAFGAGATIVRVRLDYDARARELRDVHRAPLQGSPISRTSIDERYSADRKKYTKVHALEDRGSDVHEEQTEIPAGTVARISVAIAVDAKRNLDVAAIRSLASATLGLVSDRDALDVEAVPFAPPQAEPAAPLWGFFGLVASLAPVAAWSAIAFCVVRFGGAPLGRALEAATQRLALARASRAVAGYPPAHVRGALRDEPAHTAAAIISALPAATATAVLELYPAEERAAIVRRMQRETAPIVPDCESILRHA